HREDRHQREGGVDVREGHDDGPRSEEHTSELQSHLNLVCRLLLEKTKEGSTNASFYATELQPGTHRRATAPTPHSAAPPPARTAPRPAQHRPFPPPRLFSTPPRRPRRRTLPPPSFLPP